MGFVLDSPPCSLYLKSLPLNYSMPKRKTLHINTSAGKSFLTLNLKVPADALATAEPDDAESTTTPDAPGSESPLSSLSPEPPHFRPDYNEGKSSNLLIVARTYLHPRRRVDALRPQRLPVAR